MNGIGTRGGDFRVELKFWMIHCFVSVIPLIAFLGGDFIGSVARGR